MNMIRELEVVDIDERYFKLLCQLSGEERGYEWQTAMTFWLKYEDNDDHQVFVYEQEGEVLGTATILVENKLLHYGSRVGHIEDVVVTRKQKKKGIGKALIEECIKFAKEKDCYKVILDCGYHNIAFYESCGFRVAEGCMRLDL
jgi:glucosamine-phosphate N-acetyltransferase